MERMRKSTTRRMVLAYFVLVVLLPELAVVGDLAAIDVQGPTREGPRGKSAGLSCPMCHLGGHAARCPCCSNGMCTCCWKSGANETYSTSAELDLILSPHAEFLIVLAPAGVIETALEMLSGPYLPINTPPPRA